MWRQLQALIDAYEHEHKRPHYHYPDDVIVETVEGKREARLAMTLKFKTEKPCLFEAWELEALRHAFTMVWERARERYRNFEREEFMSKHPTVARERQVWQEFLDMKGVKPDENPYERGITPTCSEFVQWREPRLREMAEKIVGV